MFVCFQVIQTSKALLESSEGVYERILQTQKAGKIQSHRRRKTLKRQNFLTPLTSI